MNAALHGQVIRRELLLLNLNNRRVSLVAGVIRIVGRLCLDEATRLGRVGDDARVLGKEERRENARLLLVDA